MTVIIAHLLFVVSLVGFGLRSDGWVLHPVAVAWYGLCVLGSAGAFLYALRTTGGAAWLPVIPAILALAVVGAYPATSLLGGARYAPYEWFVSMNFIPRLLRFGGDLSILWEQFFSPLRADRQIRELL